MASELITMLANRIETFQNEARRILSQHETSRERVVTLSEARKKIQFLSISQSNLFDQALLCIEHGIYRAAHVMAWAAFVDFVEDKLTHDGLECIHHFYPAWSKYKTKVELRENVNEHQLLDAAKSLGILHRQEHKVLQGLLAKRNECAHPSECHPGMNESLGYVDELLRRVPEIQKRIPKKIGAQPISQALADKSSAAAD